MTLVPALAEQQAAHIERRRRMGMVKPVVVSFEAVRRPVPVEPETAPEEPDIVTLPDFLGMHARRSDWFDDTTREVFRPASATVILRTVSIMTRVRLLDIVSRRRPTKVAQARHIACWIMRYYTPMSSGQIANKLGGRDHTTILYAIGKIDQLRSDSREFTAYVDNIVANVMAAMETERGP